MRDCQISIADAKREFYTFGKDVATIRGKIKRKNRRESNQQHLFQFQSPFVSRTQMLFNELIFSW